MTIPIISCAFCKHFKQESFGENVCDAFPEGIPDYIVYGDHQHTVQMPGDRGIQFEPLEGVNPDFVKLFENIDAEIRAEGRSLDPPPPDQESDNSWLRSRLALLPPHVLARIDLDAL